MTVGKIKFHKRTIRKAPVAGKTILLRTDYNVPMTDGKIDDDFRIRASLPTIESLLAQGCKLVIVSHLGRPDGKPDKQYSLEPVAKHLSKLTGRDVRFIEHTVGIKVKTAVKQAPKNSIVMLENVRFHPEEEQNDARFARSLAQDSGAEYFVQDCFGVAHRAHASVVAIAQYLPSVAGLLLESEYVNIVSAMKKPRRPLLAILGGAKVSDKLQIVDELVSVADQVVIGGAMANTLLAERGYRLGKSKVETDQSEAIKEIDQAVASKVGEKFKDNFLVLPIDVAVAKSIDDKAERRSIDIADIADDDIALDIGDQSIERIAQAINRAQTIIWNGTLGMAELPNFAHGSARTALEIAQQKDTMSIIGGGDTADFVLHWDARQGGSFSHVSTGGGASLDLMAGEKLPGIECLLDDKR